MARRPGLHYIGALYHVMRNAGTVTAYELCYELIIEEGTNTFVGTTGEKILQAYNAFKKGFKKAGKIPELWDGKTAGRIIEILMP